MAVSKIKELKQFFPMNDHCFKNEILENLVPLSFDLNQSVSNQFRIKTLDGQVILTENQWSKIKSVS